MKTSVASMLLAVAVLCTSQAHAHTFIYNLEDGSPVFRVSFPDGWRLDLDFDPPDEGTDAPPPPRVVEAIPKDGARLWLGMWVITEIQDVKDARGYFESLEQFLFSDVKTEETGDDDLNGMPSRFFRGTAKKKNEPVEWAILLFKTGPETVSALMYIGVPEAWRQHSEELTAIVDSISLAN
jgi:hypothetical protein